jgi:ketosteroid isomerase-like protein
MDSFRAAVEAGDLAAATALLAEDVVFTSPVVFKPYQGKAITSAILGAVFRVFEDFRYDRAIHDGDDHVLVFHARVGERTLQGIDLLHTNSDGLIDAFTVMVRPMSGAQALQERMAVEFERISAEG